MTKSELSREYGDRIENSQNRERMAISLLDGYERISGNRRTRRTAVMYHRRERSVEPNEAGSSHDIKQY